MRCCLECHVTSLLHAGHKLCNFSIFESWENLSWWRSLFLFRFFLCSFSLSRSLLSPISSLLYNLISEKERRWRDMQVIVPNHRHLPVVSQDKVTITTRGLTIPSPARHVRETGKRQPCLRAPATWRTARQTEVSRGRYHLCSLTESLWPLATSLLHVSHTLCCQSLLLWGRGLFSLCSSLSPAHPFYCLSFFPQIRIRNK